MRPYGHSRWAVGGALAVTLAAPADTPFAPARIGLGPVAQRIAHEDCRLLIVGDSNSVKSAVHSTVGGVCRTWMPDQFVGRVSPGTASSDEGIRITSSHTGLDVTARAIFHVGTGDPHTWSNGQDGFIPNRAWDMVSTGTGLSSNVSYCVCELTRLDEYPGGDWTADGSLRARLIYAHDQTGLTQLRYRASRGVVSGPFAAFTPHDDAARAWIDHVDADVPDGDGLVSTQIRTLADWTSDGQGGAGPCPDNCVPGRSLFHVAQLIWRTDVEGLQVDSIAEGGFTVADHLAAAKHYDDDALRLYLEATRNPNCFMLLLGQNMTWPQMQDIEGLWRSHVLELVERYRSAALEVEPGGDPLFLLVAPWSTDDDSDRNGRMSLVLADIAASRPDTGFVNLHLVAGANRYLRPGTLPDGVHYGDDDAADLLTGLIWEQIQRELDGAIDLLVQGDTQDLSLIEFQSGTIVHVASGAHDGPVVVQGDVLELRGWNAETCAITGTDDGPAIQGLAGATVHVSRLQLLPGAGGVDSDGIHAGASVHVDSGELQLHDVDVHGGAVPRGGALALRNAACTIDGSQLHLGTAQTTGGIIDARNSSIQLIDALIDGGQADSGGGLYASGGTLLLENSFIRDCTAETGGGAVLHSVSGSLEGGTVRHNHAIIAGGLLLIESDVEVTDSVICSNKPDDVVGDWFDGGGNSIGGACACPADLDANGVTDVSDLLIVLSFWGATDGAGDADGDGSTGVSDLLAVISDWGPCP